VRGRKERTCTAQESALARKERVPIPQDTPSRLSGAHGGLQRTSAGRLSVNSSAPHTSARLPSELLEPDAGEILDVDGEQYLRWLETSPTLVAHAHRIQGTGLWLWYIASDTGSSCVR
jgi:hypothetical protein